MKEESLTKEDVKLISKAKKMLAKTHVRNGKIVSDVICIIITENGKMFWGVDIEGLAPGSGVCAETSAMTNMILDGRGNEKIKTVCAIYGEPHFKKQIWQVFPPCHKCRKNLKKFGNPWVFFSDKKKKKLK